MRVLFCAAAAVTLAIASPTFASAASEPSCDDVVGLSSAITTAIATNPSSATVVSTNAIHRCPADAAVIATAAVNADPNAAQAIIDAILAALPPEDRANNILTTALTELAGAQGPRPPGPAGIGAPLVATWTDPHTASPR